MKKLVSLDKIIVHGGKSHADEIIAVMLAEASTCDGKIIPVFRRDPTEEELADNRVLVMDVGGRLDDWSMNFDHHQFERDHEPECAFSLIAKEIDAAAELKNFFGWFATWRMIDSKGPFAWAKANGVDWGVASTLLSPVDDIVHEWFEEASGDTPVDEALVRRLQKKGRAILDAAARFVAFCDEVRAKGLKLDVDGVTVYDLRRFDANESLDNGDKLAKADGVVGGVLVSKDNRGPGDSYYRRQDDPAVDFHRCADKPYCAFAHIGGFILKTTEPGSDLPGVIRDAKTE